MRPEKEKEELSPVESLETISAGRRFVNSPETGLAPISKEYKVEKKVTSKSNHGDLAHLCKRCCGKEACKKTHLYYRKLITGEEFPLDHSTAEMYERVFKGAWISISDMPRVYAIYEALAESTLGEILRFLLGDQQPKTRMLLSKGRLYIVSKYLENAPTLYKFLDFRKSENHLLMHNANQFYLNKLPEALIYNLMARNYDLHHQQILVKKEQGGNKKNNNLSGIIIDFGRTVRGKYPSDYTRLIFNSADIQYQPFVGEVPKKGGQYLPENWLWSRAYKGNGQFTSCLQHHSNDPRTYLNPRFQAEKHRGILRLLLFPTQIIFSRFLAPNQEVLKQLVSSDEPHSLATTLSQKFINEMGSGVEDLFKESAKIAEFVDYLKNITLQELAELATEFFEYVSKNQKEKHVKLTDVLGASREEILNNCIAHLRQSLLNAPFNFKAEELPIQLHLFEGNKAKFTKFAFSKSLWPHSNPIFLFCSLQNRVRQGADLVLSSETISWESLLVLKNLIPNLEQNIQFMQRLATAQTLMKEVLQNFDLDLFFKVLNYIQNPKQTIKPEIPIKKESSNLFLCLNSITLQKILNHYFKHLENYEDQCMALGVQNIWEEFRSQKLEALKKSELVDLVRYASVSKSYELTQAVQALCPYLTPLDTITGIVRNAMEFARAIPEKSFAQRFALKIFDQFGANPSLYIRHYWQVTVDERAITQVEIQRLELVALLNNAVFDFSGEDLIQRCQNIPELDRNKNAGIDVEPNAELRFMRQLEMLAEPLSYALGLPFSFRAAKKVADIEGEDFLKKSLNSEEIIQYEYIENLIEKMQPYIEKSEDVKKFLDDASRLFFRTDSIVFILDIIKRSKKLARKEGYDTAIFNSALVHGLFYSLEKKYTLKNDVGSLMDFRLSNGVKNLRLSSVMKVLETLVSHGFKKKYPEFFVVLPEEVNENFALRSVILIAIKIRLFIAEQDRYEVLELLQLIFGREKIEMLHGQFQHEESLLHFSSIIWQSDIYELDSNNSEERNYYNLIRNRIQHPIFKLFQLSFWRAWEYLAKGSAYSDHEQEQLLLIHDLLENSALQDKIFDGLKLKLMTLALCDNSTQFIYNVMKTMQNFLDQQTAHKYSVHLQKTISTLSASLFYALPYDSRKVNAHNLKSESPVFDTNKTRSLISLTQEINQSSSRPARSKFSQNFLSDIELDDLEKKLKSEIDRQIKIKNKMPEPKKSRFECRINALKKLVDFINSQEKVSWKALEAELRNLASNRDINYHQREWKNSYRFFKTETRKKIDRFHRAFVEPYRKSMFRAR